jgi:hypothetical protein
VRLVRGADLDELRPRQREDLGQAERAADLDQLAARDHDLLARGEAGEPEHRRGRVVVRDDRVLGAGEVAQQLAQVIVARAALALVEVVLDVRVAAGDLLDRGACGRGERRAAEVRVQDHAGRVDHAAQLRARQPQRDLGDIPGRDRRRVGGAREDRLASLVDRTARRLDERPARGIGDRGRVVGECVDRGKLDEAWITHG